jgi:probable lipoprotein
MKNVKQIILAFVAIFAAILLVACGAKGDNGTYVYKPTKAEMRKILKDQGASSSDIDSLNNKYSLELSIDINDSKGYLNIKTERPGHKTVDSTEIKVNQKTKTIGALEGKGEKVKYKIKGDTLTLNFTKDQESTNQFASSLLKNAKFKRTK